MLYISICIFICTYMRLFSCEQLEGKGQEERGYEGRNGKVTKGEKEQEGNMAGRAGRRPSNFEG